jgi:hypothetical protein
MADTSAPKVVAHPRAELTRPHDLRSLVHDMSQWRHAPVAGVHLLAISLGGAVPQSKQTPEMVSQISNALCALASLRGIRLYQTAHADFAVLVRISGELLMDLLRDLKVELLRVVERHCPESFGAINQNRFVMIFNLTENYRAAAERVAKYAADAQKAAEQPEGAQKTLRPLSPEDLENVLHAFKKFGSEKFLKAFMRDQVVVQNVPGVGLQPLMHEYFISMDSLRKPLFIDVEMRASGQLFNDFTRVLDQIVLRAFKHLDVTPLPFSININVVTAFTAAFADFMDQTPKDVLSRIVFEFRQADIVEHFDEFEVARGMILAMGAQIGVDKIFPQTLGLIDLDYIGAKYAKVLWREGAEDLLQERGKTFKYMLDCGLQPILIRVDNQKAITAATALGVDTFQGFLIDDTLRKRAA